MFDSDRCWQAIEACDPRFDGWVFCGVTSTGIYCRPSCPARTPKRENVRFFATAAAAQMAGFRACKRCRPDATPGSPEWDSRADVVGRAMRLIADGVVDREGAQRAKTARILLETTGLPITAVAFAAGFRSVRQFNATVREVFAMAPGELRRRARRHGPPGGGGGPLRLPFRAPLDGAGLIAFLGRRAVPGIEAVADGRFIRSLRLPRGAGTVELSPADDHIQARFRLDDLRDLGPAVQRCRALLDLDSDPQAVAEILGGDALL